MWEVKTSTSSERSPDDEKASNLLYTNLHNNNNKNKYQ